MQNHIDLDLIYEYELQLHRNKLEKNMYLKVLLRYSIQNRKSRFLLEIESDWNRDFRAPPKQFCPL